jgi:gamma-glutamyl-gamma-aminobutyrate hydrolase PuuD
MRDYWRLSWILPQLDGLVMMGGRDIHPIEYGEEIKGSIVPPESRMIYNHIKTILDNIKP